VLLKQLQVAMLERSKAVNSSRSTGVASPLVDMEPPTATEFPNRSPAGLAIEAYGADLALELCWQELTNSEEQVRVSVEISMELAQRAALTSTRSIIGDIFKHCS